MSARGKRIAMLIEQDFEDAEVTEPLKIFKNAGIHATIVGNGSQITYLGKRRKAKFRPETTADKVNPQDYDALYIPGGYAPDNMRLYEPMVELVKKFHSAGKLIAAICHGPQLLISAEVISGYRVTSWPSVAIDLKNAGAEWLDAPVVMDRDLITSRTTDDMPEFTRAVINALERVPAITQSPG